MNTQYKANPPYRGNEPYIFISYSHKNMEEAFGIVNRLQEDGYRVWYDEGIDPGTEWAENIAEHVEKCSLFIALISTQYLGSSNCQDELDYARELEKNRLVVYLEDVELSGGMKMRLGRIQAIHKYTYRDEKNFYDKLYTTSGIKICHGGQNVSSNVQNNSAISYTNGKGTNIDETEEVKLYRAAAERGNAIAQFNLGCWYYFGEGIDVDQREAVKWFRAAAEQGYAEAQFNLGVCYEKGRGIGVDQREAVK